jgi:hypothetical protein
MIGIASTPDGRIGAGAHTALMHTHWTCTCTHSLTRTHCRIRPRRPPRRQRISPPSLLHAALHPGLTLGTLTRIRTHTHTFPTPNPRAHTPPLLQSHYALPCYVVLFSYSIYIYAFYIARAYLQYLVCTCILHPQTHALHTHACTRPSIACSTRKTHTSDIAQPSSRAICSAHT